MGASVLRDLEAEVLLVLGKGDSIAVEFVVGGFEAVEVGVVGRRWFVCSWLAFEM